MEASVAIPARSSTVHSDVISVPWYCHAVVFASASILAGVLWDISWHMTIGRDTFWTPAHILMYLGGVLAGVSCGYLVLKTTFAGTAQDVAASVRVWGFRGPLGAWFAIWGAFAMITSAPFDDWWHNAYGLDVEILSPPHVVLAFGMMAIAFGAVLLTLARLNRQERDGRWSRLSYTFSSGLSLTLMAILVTEYTEPNRQHGSTFYIVTSLVFPALVVALGRASNMRWGATAVAACYAGVMLVMGWTLQLFPARPMLAPIYNPVDHMVPLAFPLLLVVPGLAIDWLLRRMRGRNEWLTAAAVAVAFLTIFFVTQWYFSAFLLSNAGHNALFMGGRSFSYNERPGPWMHEYWDSSGDFTLISIAIALGLAYVSARIGLAGGKGLQRVMR